MAEKARWSLEVANGNHPYPAQLSANLLAFKLPFRVENVATLLRAQAVSPALDMQLLLSSSVCLLRQTTLTDLFFPPNLTLNHVSAHL